LGGELKDFKKKSATNATEGKTRCCNQKEKGKMLVGLAENQ